MSGKVKAGWTLGPPHAAIRSKVTMPPRSKFCFLALFVAAVWLSGCSYSDELASALVAPGKFDLYNCDQLTVRTRETAKRERELKLSMQEAERGSAGGFINALAYRTDYLTARGELIELEQTATAKNCGNAYKSVSERALQ